MLKHSSTNDVHEKRVNGGKRVRGKMGEREGESASIISQQKLYSPRSSSLTIQVEFHLVTMK